MCYGGFGGVTGDRKLGTKTGNPIDVAVGARIRNLRLRHKLSQAEVARHLNITFQQIQKYEKGANRVGASRLSELAKLFGVSVDAFFTDINAGGSGKNTPQPIDQLTDRHAVRLVEAYQALHDRKLKLAIVQLAEHMARCQSK